MEHSVEFLSQGDTLRGTLFRPDDVPDGPLPAVVMAGGWCYVKESSSRSTRGFVERRACRLDLRLPRLRRERRRRRQHLDPWAQIEDYKNAITYLSHATTSMPTRSARAASPTAAATC